MGRRSYEIHIGAGLLDHVGRECQRLNLGKHGFLITDSNVGLAYADRVQAILSDAGFIVSPVVVPAGEESKSKDRLFHLYDEALANSVDRKSFVVALGGGVVGDLAGYFASTYLRGIPWIQIPTSLMAMVDSSVGGKTGINLPQGKNLVGAFYQPLGVFADTQVLTTLPGREYLSGLAEVVKYGVIRDSLFFSELQQHIRDLLEGEGIYLANVVAKCCAIKASVVSSDERDQGVRATLNFGHTLGHAVEQATGYGRFLHGEAVALGMVFAARLSARVKGLDPRECEDIVELLGELGLPIRVEGCAWADIRKAMSVDKKNIGRALHFVLIKKIGQVVAGCEIPDSVLEEVWNVCCQ